MLPDELVATRKKEQRLTALIALAIVAAVISFGLAACTSMDDHRPVSSSSATSPGPEDGVLPDNASPFDTSLPGVANLNPQLLKAIQNAATAAERDGITLHLTTGWRSRTYQQELLDKAIAKYGSREKAAEYVADPNESHHVTGSAIDVGPTNADDWLNRKGHRFGLCQTLANEIWHFELATTPGSKCPPMKSSTNSG
ncbi:M15 family metallopeptidase [Kribbella sp. NPDC023855]|uniref:M15 family metallopeptidase n=1 Tax=Kribbella sp. NPDC023855 TaxID=3154698 RepID=UPI0033FEA731